MEAISEPEVVQTVFETGHKELADNEMHGNDNASELAATTQESHASGSPAVYRDRGLSLEAPTKIYDELVLNDMYISPAETPCLADTRPADPAVVELRKRITPEVSKLLTDSDCMRFLRARSMNTAKAAEMVAKWGVWWESKLPGTNILPREITLHPDSKEVVYQDLMPHANLGESKTGCPIYWEKTGQISSIFYEVKKRLTEDEIFVRHIRQQEVMVRRLHNASQRYGRPIEKQVIVMDMKNVAMTIDFMAMRVFKRTVVIDEACYPERLETLFMINCPFTFTALWTVIKPWIDPVTVSKFKILGSNYQAELKAQIDEDQIPVEYGGTRKKFGWTYPDNIAPYDRMAHY